jgi:hypothetical protein
MLFEKDCSPTQKLMPDFLNLMFGSSILSMYVGPCHHGMARPQVADVGTAFYMEGSCE